MLPYDGPKQNDFSVIIKPNECQKSIKTHHYLGKAKEVQMEDVEKQKNASIVAEESGRFGIKFALPRVEKGTKSVN